MTVPTVLATTARRSCRLCSASESWPTAIPVVVIGSPPLAGHRQNYPLPFPPGAAGEMVNLATLPILIERGSGSSSLPLPRKRRREAPRRPPEAVRRFVLQRSAPAARKTSPSITRLRLREWNHPLSPLPDHGARCVRPPITMVSPVRPVLPQA